jgi:CheY-like chemotaxis protein
VDLTRVLRQASDVSRETLETAGHRLLVDLPDAPLFVDADPGRLIQIVENLLGNATKYTPSGGTISLSLRRSEADAIIAVRDTGIGIAGADLPAIFGIFTQLPSGANHSQGGLGIGLSLVRALTERHGGEVSVVSEGPGKGSEFTVRLPLSALQTADPAATPVFSVERPRPHRVLIVDDNEDAALSLATLLEIDGHDARTAFNGTTALGIISDLWPDVVVIDIGLPDMSGYELAKLARKTNGTANVVLIALTGRSQSEDRRAAILAGFQHFMTKPVDYEALLGLLP